MLPWRRYLTAFLTTGISQQSRDSTLHELHLGTSQLDEVPIFQGHWIGSNGCAIERGITRTFHMVHDKSVLTFRDGGNRHAWFSNGGHHFCQGNFTL